MSCLGPKGCSGVVSKCFVSERYGNLDEDLLSSCSPLYGALGPGKVLGPAIGPGSSQTGARDMPLDQGWGGKSWKGEASKLHFRASALGHEGGSIQGE